MNRTLSLKRLLVLLGVLGGTYVLGIIAYLAFALVPTASQLRNDTEDLLNAYEVASAHIEGLHDVVMVGENLLRGRRQAGALPPDSAALFRGRVAPLIEHESGAALSEQVPGLPDPVRNALVDAEIGELAVAEGVLAALAALERGAFDEAIEHVTTADHDRTAAEEALVRAQTMALHEVLVREYQLQATVSRATMVLIAWGLLGAAFMLASFLVLRARLYRPMAQLETALAGVTGGDLETELSIRSGDEMGRLGTMMNQMIAVLRQRDAAAETRERNLIERYSRILDESGTSLLVVDPESMTAQAGSDRALRELGVDAASLRGRAVEEIWRAAPELVSDVLTEVADGRRSRGVFLADQLRADGTSVKVEISAIRVHDREQPEIVAVVHELTARQGLEYVHEQLARFTLENAAVLESGDIQTAFTKLTELSSELLGVEVAGVWMMDGQTLRLADSYDRRTRTHASGTEILVDEAPGYFAALESERTIAANDARIDPSTRELKDYLAAGGVVGLLDVPIRRQGRVIGVFCHEHHDVPRVWTPEEKVLGAAMGDFVTRVLEQAEWLLADSARRATERRYRSMFESAAVGIAELDVEGRYLTANATLLEMLGYELEELQQMTWADVTHPEDLRNDREAAAKMQRGELDLHQAEKRYVRKDGSVVWVNSDTTAIHSEDGRLVRVMTVAKDVSEALELRDQLAHSQRMDSVGRLAGGIAHDFNNLLTAVLGNSEMMRRRLDSDSDLLAELGEIEESARRASGLTRQLLTFARRQDVQPSVVELDMVARGAERLLRRLIGENIELVTELDAVGAQIRIDPQQFDQVIVNLTVNARDAMPEGGRITIRSRMMDTSTVRGLKLSNQTEARFVVLEVEDNGRGMDEGVRQRAFEPFFTTKEAGEGTGLGLATCYGIVAQAGGRIDVESVRDVGTVFRVYLPAVHDELTVGPEDPAEPDFVAGRTVLVVEDADPVRRLIVESLELKGYTVLEAADGQEAVELAGDYVGVIDLIVSDIVMPRMNGPKAVEAIRRLRSDIRVLFISGYSAETLRDGALAAPGTAFLSKPFAPSELVNRVNELAEDMARSEAGQARAPRLF